LKILDTFAGIGGFSYAAEQLVGGFTTTQFIEINPYCQKILKKHWPHVPIHDDIKTFTAKSGEFDIITGGFPCQDISVAGLQAGITKETRSGLFFELMRVIRMVRPKYIVLENVAAILNRGLDIVLRELSQAGYDAEWAVISASSVGACHQRSRWWLVAYPNKSDGRQGGVFKNTGNEGWRTSKNRGESIQSEDGETCADNFEQGNGVITNPNDNGSSSSERFRFNGQANNSTQERQNETCKLKGSSQSRNSTTIQQTTESSNPSCEGLQRQNIKEMERTIWPESPARRLNPSWRSYESKPVLCRGDDGLRGRMDRLKALGNSIVPQVAAIPLQRVKDLYATAS